MIGASVLCVLCVQVIKTDDYGKITAAFLHAFASFFTIGLQAYAAQKVMDTSLEIHEETYKMDKNFLLIIAMSQKQLKFNGGFFDASFHTLSLVLSRTMSLLTLLKSFID